MYITSGCVCNVSSVYLRTSISEICKTHCFFVTIRQALGPRLQDFSLKKVIRNRFKKNRKKINNTRNPWKFWKSYETRSIHGNPSGWPCQARACAHRRLGCTREASSACASWHQKPHEIRGYSCDLY